MPLISASCREDTNCTQSAPRKVKRKEQWLEFQKTWLANLRRDILGTEDEFGNPHAGSKDGHTKIFLPDPVRIDSEDGLPMRTLILDLDETLVHTEFDQQRGWITHRRPGVEAFLKTLSASYEIICFTSGLKPYASPIIDQLDPPPSNLIAHRLYREHTLALEGMHVKDLSRLPRDPRRTILVDNSPESYLLQPENAVPMKAFFGDPADDCLARLAPLLLDIVRRRVPDVRSVLKRCHLRGRFDDAGPAARAGGKPKASGKAAASSPPGPPPLQPPDRRISDLGLAPEPPPATDDAFLPRPRPGPRRSAAPPPPSADRAEPAGEGDGVDGGVDAADGPARARAAHVVLHRGLSDGALPPPSAHPPPPAAAAAALDDALREGGPAAGSSAGPAAAAAAAAAGGALVDWSAAHGAFADVLRGMSPPARTPLPGPEAGPAADDEA